MMQERIFSFLVRTFLILQLNSFSTYFKLKGFFAGVHTLLWPAQLDDRRGLQGRSRESRFLQHWEQLYCFRNYREFQINFSLKLSSNIKFLFQLCYGDQFGDIFPCPTNQNYCAVNSGGDRCSSVQPEECRPEVTQSAQDFVCTGLGYFPDLGNCSKYYFCGNKATGPGFVASPQSCLGLNVFDPNSANFCSRRNDFLRNCKTAQCGNVTEITYEQITYGTNRQYYTLCVPNSASNSPRVYACPSNTQPNLSGFPAVCEYRCTRVGMFENTSDRSKYFECYWNGFLRLESASKTCPPNSQFNPARSQCEANIKGLSFEADNI